MILRLEMIPKAFEHIISRFPQQFTFAFAYGSGVFPQNPQHQTKENMIDFIFAVDNPVQFHEANLRMNRKDYSSIRAGGCNFIGHLQKQYGAKMYFNTLIKVEKQIIKYGVISSAHLTEDLLDWQTLYASGRLHKPVVILKTPQNQALKDALNLNLLSALHASLLCLPDTFSDEELFLKVAALSYIGDFRMYFGEDRRKIQNIVKAQLQNFRNLYSRHIRDMPFLQWDQNEATFEQECSTSSNLYHLNQLPKNVQHYLLIQWNRDGRHRDMEDVLEDLAHDSECSDVVETAIRQIVLWPTIAQSAKGILTAGLVKSVKYSSSKLRKMFKSMSIQKQITT